MRRRRPYRRLKWEIALDEYNNSGTPTLWNGHLEEAVDAVNEFVPPKGKVDANFPLTERFRKLQNIYYDVYNNGGCNCIGMNENDNVEHWGVKRSTMSAWRRKPELLEAKVQNALRRAVGELLEGGFLEVNPLPD